MKVVACLSAARAGRSPILFLLMLVALPTSAWAFVNFDWAAAVSGSADDPSKWNPSGIPSILDNIYFGQSGSYTVTYPATVPNTAMISLGAGTVTFNVASPHTTRELLIGGFSGLPTLTQAYGALNTDYLNLGYPGSQSRLTLTNTMFNGSATLHSFSMGNRYYGGAGGDIVGYGGIAYLDVFGGAQYTCERSQVGSWPLQIGKAATAVGTVSIAGRDAQLFTYSALRVTGSELGEGVIAGVAGTANIFVYNGGYMDVAGNMMIAQLAGSNGWVTVGPTSFFGVSALNVHNHLWIGFNFYDTLLAGHGEVTVKGNSYIHVGGRCDVGDPDNDAGSLLRVAQGATFRVNGGIKFWPTSGQPLDLRGGLTHVRAGEFIWPAGKYLTVSSQVGTPVLTISNGIVNTAPSTPAFNAQLFVARGGTGTLRITQPGTVFPMGLGATTLGDSLGGVGKVVVDSSATLSSGGPLNVGVRGNGELDVLGGSLADVGTVAIGVAATGLGTVSVRGAGSLLQARDNLWIGGGFGGVGSTGTVEVDSNGTVNVLHVTGVNPALTTVFTYGTLAVANGGRLVTTGTVSNSGSVIVQDGRIEALNISQPSAGRLSGWGRLVTSLQSNGRVGPYSATDAFGTLRVDGNVFQFGAGHYDVDLGTVAGLQCDSLVVNGPVTLAGALDLRTQPGFAPNPGVTFTIMTYTSRTGAFDSVTWNGVPLTDEATVVYTPTSVRVDMPGMPVGVDPGTSPGAVTQLRFAPASSGAILSFALDLPAAADVQVKVYDLRGREVDALYDGALAPGQHHLVSRTGGRNLPSGAYFARAVIRADGQETVRTARTIVVH